MSKYIGTRDSRNTQIVALGVDAYLKMLLHDNFVHTDLHPGNILVRPRTEGPAQEASSGGFAEELLQLILLDFGLAEELTPVVRRHFISLLHMIGKGGLWGHPACWGWVRAAHDWPKDFSTLSIGRGGLRGSSCMLAWGARGWCEDVSGAVLPSAVLAASGVFAMQGVCSCAAAAWPEVQAGRTSALLARSQPAACNQARPSEHPLPVDLSCSSRPCRIAGRKTSSHGS